ncbi:MAG: copper oxidase, partial [Duganella sp.]
MNKRRHFLNTGATLLGASLVSRAGAASLPEAPLQSSSATAAPLVPPNGRPYNP